MYTYKLMDFGYAIVVYDPLGQSVALFTGDEAYEVQAILESLSSHARAIAIYGSLPKYRSAILSDYDSRSVTF